MKYFKRIMRSLPPSDRGEKSIETSTEKKSTPEIYYKIWLKYK